jgi:hypothetical protein
MRIKVLLSLYSFLSGPLYAVGQNSVYDLNAKPEAVQVSILATSTSVHQNFAGSQEVYLADISSRRAAHRLAKLVDNYPSSALPIRRALLSAHHPFRMKLTRDPECDATGNTFFLGAESNVFDVDAPGLLRNHATAVIPCYKVDHHATHLAK